MVNIKLIFKNSGVYEWIAVRLSAITIALYIMYILSFILFTSHLSYIQWYNFFDKNLTKIFNMITILFILTHTWIGIRHILEDYIKSLVLRKIGVGLTCMVLYIYLLLSIVITWGI